jgi:hypothetical protein
MQNIFDIHDYDESFLDRFCSQTIPIYDLWSIRPLQNDQKEIITGGSGDVDKFRNFIIDHSNQDFPHPLVIVIGNAEKTNSGRMSNTSKKYFKLKFEKFKGNDLGTPLTLSGTPEPYPTNQSPPFAFNGVNPNPMNPLQGFSLGDIHGIIDRNVADATRSIKAEYEEQAARREAENIKRLAELETRMEMYKLEMRAKEVESREQELRRELEELERKKAEGLGTVKDYTKTIAGGLFELGKSAFGIDDIKDKTELDNNVKPENKSNLGTTSIVDDDNDGFEEVSTKKATEFEQENNLNVVLQGIANLDDEQKMALLDALLPAENDEKATNKTESESIDKTDIVEFDDKENNNQTTNETQTDNIQKTEKNEDV